jgi:5-methylthioadenosine/S-adenosylhomocysteine deaminase
LSERITAVRGAWVVSQDAERSVFKGDVAIEGERVAYAGPSYEGAWDEEIDARGDIVMPGLVNTHTHVAMTVMKGAADDLAFPDFLSRVFAIDSDRTDGDILAGARLGCAEMALGGTTTFVDMYYSEDVVAGAVEEAGLRGVLCWCVLDDDKTTQRGSPIDNCRRFIDGFAGRRKIVPGAALQGVYVCGEETCAAAKALSDEKEAPLALHLSETRGEVNEHRRKTGMRPAEWLADKGVLGPRAIAAHSAWLTLAEARAMGATGMSVSLCPVSNMKLATGGVAPLPELMGSGAGISIGTDGSSTNNSLDMLAEAKTLGLLQKSSRWDPTVATAQQLLDFATLGGARAVGMGDMIGSIEPGKYADLVILDGHAPNMRPLVAENVVSNIIYSSSAANVKTVMCQGDVLVRDGEAVRVDVEDVLAGAEDAWSSLCRR